MKKYLFILLLFFSPLSQAGYMLNGQCYYTVEDGISGFSAQFPLITATVVITIKTINFSPLSGTLTVQFYSTNIITGNTTTGAVLTTTLPAC